MSLKLTEVVNLIAPSHEAANIAADLGEDFGANLTEREVAWLMDKEFAKTAEDVIWRRSKLGLRFTYAQIERLQS